MQEEKQQSKGKMHAKIVGMLVIEPKPSLKQFSRDGALQAIAQFIVCDDQVKKLNIKVKD